MRIAGFKMRQQARLPRFIYTAVGGGAPGDDPGYCGVPPEASRAVIAVRETRRTVGR